MLGGSGGDVGNNVHLMMDDERETMTNHIPLNIQNSFLIRDVTAFSKECVTLTSVQNPLIL